jgi:hypothetical protein
MVVCTRCKGEEKAVAERAKLLMLYSYSVAKLCEILQGAFVNQCRQRVSFKHEGFNTNEMF